MGTETVVAGKHFPEFSTVLIYSPLWSVSAALVSLCRNSTEYQYRIITVERWADILPEAIKIKPDILVIDFPPRIIWGVLNVFRHYYPVVPVIITQPRFLFSDRVVAEYFGHIWLKEYDALLAGYPETTLMDHLLCDALAGAECGRLHYPGEYLRLSHLRTVLTRQIRHRLLAVTGSMRLCEVVMDWLVKGKTPAEVSLSLVRSTKLVYHYRWCVMRGLNIERPVVDFIPSLTVEMLPDHDNIEDVFSSIHHHSCVSANPRVPAGDGSGRRVSGAVTPTGGVTNTMSFP